MLNTMNLFKKNILCCGNDACSESVLSGRDNNFNFIRLAAALAVLIGHTYTLSGLCSSPVIFGTTVDRLGLLIFFMMSGFLITNSWQKDPSIKRYAVKRFFRLYPALTINLLFVVLVLGPIVTICDLQTYFTYCWGYLQNNLRLRTDYLLPGVFVNSNYGVNGSLWTLPIEVCMYILIPILITFFRLKSNKYYSQCLILILVGIVCVIDVFFVNHPFTSTVYGIDMLQAYQLMTFYLIGVVYTMPLVKKYLNFPLATALLLIVICLNVNSEFSLIFQLIFLPYFVFSFAFCSSSGLQYIGKKHEISYGIYIWSFPITQTVLYFMAKEGVALSIESLLVVVIALSMVVGYLSCVLVENPSRKVMKYLLQKEFFKSDWVTR